MAEVTLEPLAWAIVWIILICIWIYRRGDPKRHPSISDKETYDHDDEVDLFIVAEVIAEEDEEEE